MSVARRSAIIRLKRLFLVLLIIVHSLPIWAQYSAVEYFEFGKSKYNDQKYFEAIDFLDKAIKLDSSFDKAVYYRGLSFQNIGQHKLAISDFTFIIDKITTYDSKSAVYFLKRAISLSGIRDISTAEENYNMAISLKPGYHEAY